MVATVFTGCGSMLSAIIATHDSERSLVPTLAALVPGAAAGLIAEVVVADANSSDATAEVADIAGCRFMASADPVGERFRAAAATVRAPWLIFLRAGTVLQPGWIAPVEAFIHTEDLRSGSGRAGIFRASGTTDPMRPALAELLRLLRIVIAGGPRPAHGLLIARKFYEDVGRHPDGADAEAAMLRRLGRRRLTMLAASATRPV